MVVVDTSVWVDYFRGVHNPHTRWLHEMLPRQPLALTDLILCELLQGAASAAAAATIERRLEPCRLWNSGGRLLARRSARQYRALRQAGYTVRSTVDCLIAAVCLHHGLQLLHRDRDYEPFERELGLKVVHP